MILLIDNYDSFVYNLARYIEQLGYKTKVVRNDQISLDEIKALAPSHLVLSPGPQAPQQAGICLDVVRHLSSKIPILGICLGHQAIAQAYGATIQKAQTPMHGRASLICHHQEGLFKGLPMALQGARYHSLIVAKENFPCELQVHAHCPHGEIMALKHHKYPCYGVQFHPESILTKNGYDLLQNFLQQSM